MHSKVRRFVAGLTAVGGLYFALAGTCSTGTPPPGPPLEIPDFVDSGEPEFAGGEDVDQIFFPNFEAQESTVALPSGVNLALSSLKVVSAEEEVQVGADGKVKPYLPTQGKVLTPVFGPDDRLVLLGYSTTGGVNTTIDAQSTALVLLYFACGIWTIPDSGDRDDALREIQNTHTAILDALTTAIENAMRANPFALNDRDPGILAALRTARQDLFAAVAAAGDKPKRADARAKPFDSHVKPSNAQDNGVAGIVSTIPGRTTEQSGVFLRYTSASDDLTPLNRKRRAGSLYVFVTAVESADGDLTEYDPIDMVSGPLEVKAAEKNSDSLAPTSGPTYDPTKSDPVDLVTDPEEPTTHFNVVVVGPALDAPDDPPALADPAFDEHRIELLTEIENLEWSAFLLDFLVPLIDEWGIGVQIKPPPPTKAETIEKLRELIEPLVEGQGISIRTTEGYKAALDLILKRFTQNVGFRDAYLSITKRKIGPANASLDMKIVTYLTIKLLNTGVEDTIEELIFGPDVSNGPDLGGLCAQLQSCNEADLWEATVATVELRPESPEVYKLLPKVRLSAKVAGEARPFCYKWSTPGAFGNLQTIQEDDSGLELITSKPNITYSANENLITENDLDEVTVAAYDMSEVAGENTSCASDAEEGELVGTATVTVVGRDDPEPCEDFDPSVYNRGPITLSVSPLRVLPGDEVTATISYDFTQTTADYTQIYLYFPQACSACATGTCICGAEEQDGLSYDFGATPLSNVSQQQVTAGIGGDPANGIPGLSTSCAWELTPYFHLPDPDVPEVVTRSFTYVFHRTNYPCPVGSECNCPGLVQAPFSPLDMVWMGNLVIVREIGFASGTSGLAVQVLNLDVDPSFDHETSDRCDQ